MTPLPGKLRFELPSLIGVFPLPGTVLFPSVDLPLFIFEPRYRRMLSDARAGSRMLAISLMRKGWEESPEPVPSAEIAGVGYLRAVVEKADGTFHILLRGLTRARILEYEQLSPYRLARIEPFEERREVRKELAGVSMRMRRLLRQKLRLTSENPGVRLRLPNACNDPEQLSFIASHHSSCPPELKQELLETQSTIFRLKNLIGVYEEELNPPESRN